MNTVTADAEGGSPGAATFVATLELTRAEEARASWQCRSLQETADRFTGRDHLSTVLGFMLFPDLLQRLLFLSLEVLGPLAGARGRPWLERWDY